MPESVTRVLLEVRVGRNFVSRERVHVARRWRRGAGLHASLERPDLGRAGEAPEAHEVRAAVPLPEQFAAALVEDEVERELVRGDRRGAGTLPDRLTLRARGLRPGQVLHVTLVEHDGTSWGAPVTLDSVWAEHVIPLTTLTPVRSAMLPEGFPGMWNYWVGPAAGRGGPDDALRPGQIERLQLSLRAAEGRPLAPGMAGVEVESVILEFNGAELRARQAATR